MSSLHTPSVTELTAQIRTLLEDNFFDVKVEGEISNLRPSSSGHVYFTLKDEGAQLPSVMWRGQAQAFRKLLEDGRKVKAAGEIQVYPPHGRYQLIVREVEPAGQGELQAAFEALKRKLAAEGLFDNDIKKPVPRISQKIGVVTAATSAAFQDIRQTIESRFPLTQIVLYPAAVQGQAAAQQIVDGIHYLDQRPDVNVIIIGRGGGSLEDLWPFNEEVVARAIFSCKTPLVSAVGHEIDFTISDFAADLRATTPTQAAVLLTPDQSEWRMWLDDQEQQLKKQLNRKYSRLEEKVMYLKSRLNVKNLFNIMDHKSQWLDQQGRLMQGLVHRKMERSEAQLQQLGNRLEAANPKRPLALGYARVMQEGKWIRRKTDFKTDKTADIRWKDGVQPVSTPSN